MRLSKFIVFVFLFILKSSFAQFSAPEDDLDRKSTSEDTYLFPVEPGSPNLLAGTMGELRSNHF
ncbi:MAG: hypothetical protein WBO32_15850, partial [Cyclobacteriaceae bacterium]